MSHHAASRDDAPRADAASRGGTSRDDHTGQTASAGQDGTAPVTLRAGNAAVTLRPAEGCRISSLRIADTELLEQGTEYGSFVMAPWCGRQGSGRFSTGGRTFQLPPDAGPHAIHGTVRHQAWRTVQRGADGRSASFHCHLADPWPYSGLITQYAELAEDGSSLTLRLGIETLGDSFPAQAGWHPWFRRWLAADRPGVEIDVDPAFQLERGADGLPTGREIAPLPGPWDDCFAMPDGVDATLTWPGQLQLRMTSPAEWAVVFDEPAETVCVEPQTGPPNGLDTHPRLVTPIDPLEVATTWSWSRPGAG